MLNTNYDYVRLDVLNSQEPLPNSSFSPFLNILNPNTKSSLNDSLSRLTSDDTLIGVGVSLKNTPLGVVIAALNTILHSARILIFYINPQHLNKDAATNLMLHLFDHLKKHRATGCDFIYQKEDKQTPFLENILKHTYWTDPSPFMLRYFFNIETFNPNWLHKRYSYPSDIQEFFWKDLSSQDRRSIEMQESQYHFPSFLSPFNDEHILDHQTSLGVRNKSGVVGWILTHRVDSNTLRYSSFFIAKNFRDRQTTTKLLASAILLQFKASPLRRCLVEIPLSLVQSHWINFAKKRLEPYATEVYHLVRVWNQLKPNLRP